MKFTQVSNRRRCVSNSRISFLIIIAPTMESSPVFLVSGVNPFDRSYHHLQRAFDHRVIQLLTEILLLNTTVVKNPLVTDFATYNSNPDSWILEQIVNGSSEMSSTTVVLTEGSHPGVAYSFAVDLFRPQLYYKARSVRENYNIYLKPFSPKLWMSLIAAAVLLTMGLIFILSREAKLPHEISYDVLARIIDVQQDRDEESSQGIQDTPREVLLQKEKWEMGEILLVCLGAVCQQGSARDPSTNAARLLILVLFVLSVVGYTAYSASVISLVSLFPSTNREQLQDIRHFSRQFKTLLYNADQIENLPVDFMESEQTSLKRGLEKALKGEAVFAGDKDVSLTFLHQQNYSANLRCMLGRTSLGMQLQRVFAVNNQSKHKHSINYNILRLRQSGLLHREKQRIFNAESPCSLRERLSVSNYVSFTQKDMLPVVNLFKWGVLTSILLLIAEKIVFLRLKGITKPWRKPNIKQESVKATSRHNITHKRDFLSHNNNFLMEKLTTAKVK